MHDQFPPGEVPRGVTFGKKVLMVPSLSPVFSHSGYLVGSATPRPNYAWIKRGETIGIFRLPVPRFIVPGLGSVAGTTEHEAIIRSPASGLLLYPYFQFQNDAEYFGRSDHGGMFSFALLLPDDEPPAEDGNYMFSRLAECVWHNRAPFLQESRTSSMRAIAEGKLREYVDEQLKRTTRTLDAMPKFNDYFQEARTKLPQLRPHLKHLLDV